VTGLLARGLRYREWVSAFNAAFAELDDEQRLERYRRLAEVALERYDIGPAEATFLAHNAGVAYRVQSADGERFVLKIAEPIGEGGGWAPASIAAVLAWLGALARETDLVQEPVSDRAGALLTAVAFDDLPEPFHCSLQRWVDGERVGHFTPDHARRIGAAVARLHRHGAAWIPPESLAADEWETGWVLARAGDLRAVVDLGILSPEEWGSVEAAAARVDEVVAGLGRGPAVWGPIHGDLHHGNILFHDGEVRLIDFGGFTRTHLAHDLGSALYHVMYQRVAVRRALAEGYGAEWLIEEVAGAAVCAAAIDNLAFQLTIPRERTSAHTARNVRELADVFCRRLLAEEPFVLA
jgi:Ser/Thr protein kinase RdoA (MazF antagonist)